MSSGIPEDGLVLVVRKECPTCQMIAPVAAELAALGGLAAIYSQDAADFPDGLDVRDDRDLEVSFRLAITIVPTLMRFDGGTETARAIGWSRQEWCTLAAVDDLAPGLPHERVGCASLSEEAGWADELQARHGKTGLGAETLTLEFPEDPFEVMDARGWTDGLPVVPPTPARVLGMLRESTIAHDHVLGSIPPAGAELTVEKAAINTVMAGCRPEYFPVVLAALDAALDSDFAWQGLLSTTMGAGVAVIVNGPVCRRIGLNSGLNALGHGTRANATIARALVLIAMNAGGARPGGVDRSTLGHPGKYGLCFAEDESDPHWQSLAASRGIGEGRSAVTVFGFCGTSIMNGETARTAEDVVADLARSLVAMSRLRVSRRGGGVLLVIAGEFWRILREAGWDRARLETALHVATAGPDGAAPMFGPGDLLITRAGSHAGLFSTIIQGWGSGPTGSQPVTREVEL